MPELFTDTRTIPSQDIHSTEINLFYRHHLLKDGIAGPSFVPVKESRFNHEIQKNEINRFRNNLVKLVETYFYQTALKLKEIELYQEAFENNKQLLLDLKSKHELGLISEIDTMLAQTKVSETHKQILSAKTAFEDSIHTLKTLLNVEDRITIISPIILKHDLQALDDLLELTKKNKEISLLKTNLEKEMLLLAEASNKQLPQVDIYFNVNKKDQDDSFTKANELKETEYTAGIMLIYPFYPADPNENYLQAKKRVEKANVRLREAELRITNQTNMLYNKIQWVEKKISIHEDQLRIFKKRLEIASDAFKERLIDLQRVYTIQDDLISGEKEYLYYQYELRILYSSLKELSSKSTSDF
ncbi:MAG: TolC family protein [Desulfobacula sp.]